MAGLVLQLREERRGNTLLPQRIRDLESVVREQEGIMRETESKIPRSPLRETESCLPQRERETERESEIERSRSATHP